MFHVFLSYYRALMLFLLTCIVEISYSWLPLCIHIAYYSIEKMSGVISLDLNLHLNEFYPFICRQQQRQRQRQRQRVRASAVLCNIHIHIYSVHVTREVCFSIYFAFSIVFNCFSHNCSISLLSCFSPFLFQKKKSQCEGVRNAQRGSKSKCLLRESAF